MSGAHRSDSFITTRSKYGFTKGVVGLDSSQSYFFTKNLRPVDVGKMGRLLTPPLKKTTTRRHP
jgi:hypothetical protein